MVLHKTVQIMFSIVFSNRCNDIRVDYLDIRVDSGTPGGGVEENRLKRCLKGGGVDSDTPGGGGFVLV
jgi:hypothetical protein